MVKSTRKNIKNAIIEFLTLIRDFRERDLENYASSTAFFFFLSIIPMCILMSALLPYTGISEKYMVEAITGFTPGMVDSIVTQMINDAFTNGPDLVGVSLAAIIAAAARGMMALIQGLNNVYDLRETRNELILTIVSVTYTAFLLGLIMVCLVLMVFGRSIKNYFTAQLPGLALPAFLSNFRYVVITIVAALVFVALYSLLPCKRQKPILQVPGAVMSAVGWLVFSLMFSAFIGQDSLYTTCYGSITTIIIFMVWMYGCFYILLLGAYINYGLPRIISPMLERRKSRRRRSAAIPVKAPSDPGRRHRRVNRDRISKRRRKSGGSNRSGANRSNLRQGNMRRSPSPRSSSKRRRRRNS
ncbi:MAG: YihY/virulence factor BrkB family protein [Lachnospiraceae bacterium]|nr:YihY/virulence factor BrkB family protein [Lachnospiraceae bacterium]